MAGLGELQLKVLDRLTSLGEGAVQDIVDAFTDERRPRYTTVTTVLKSLEKRGLVTHRASGRTYIYSPLRDATEVRRGLLQEVVDHVFGGSRKALMLALLGSESVTAEELAELRRILDSRGETADE